MFNCSLCTKTFKTRESLKVHIVSHTKEKPHKCLSCSASFSLKGKLTNHIKNLHSGIKFKNVQCPQCSYKCRRRGDLKTHLLKHSAERPFSCNVPSCSFKTKHKSSLQKHLVEVHSGSTPYKCKSEGCNYEASRRGHLYSHLKTHSDERPFACNVQGCSYTCKTKEVLQNHTKHVHINERPWKCSTCDFRTNHKSSLKSHQVTHNSTKDFHCQAPNCRYACNIKRDIVMHFDRKHRKKEILCTEPGCKCRFATNALLKIHLRSHKLPILKCPAGSCAYSARLKGHLRVHISRRHGGKQGVSALVAVRPNLANTGPTAAVETRHCPFPSCGYQTDFPHRYDLHIMTLEDKDDQRKHVCKLCSSEFTVLAALEDHIRRHIGEKPHRCSQCDYTSVDGKSLREHAQRVHRIFVISLGNENKYEKKCRTCSLNFSSYSEFMLHSMTHLKPVVVLGRLRVQVM